MSQCGALFHQGQLDVFDRDCLAGGRIKSVENFDCTFSVGAADDEFFSAPEDRHVKRGRNLAQIFIHWTAQVRQALVVKRLGNEMQGLRGRFGFQCSWLLLNDDFAAQRIGIGVGDRQIDHFPDQARPVRSAVEIDDTVVFAAALQFIRILF